MSYYISAYIAKREVFDEANIRCRNLTHGYAIAVDLSESVLTRSRGLIAYVYTSMFGGGEDGREARVYLDGALCAEYDEKNPNAIDTALREIGVKRTATEDEFDILGLGAERRNEWISSYDPYQEEW